MPDSVATADSVSAATVRLALGEYYCGALQYIVGVHSSARNGRVLWNGQTDELFRQHVLATPHDTLMIGIACVGLRPELSTHCGRNSIYNALY